MKRLCVVIAVLILAQALLIIPVFGISPYLDASFSEIENGKITLTVSCGPVENLTELSVKIKYDTSVFSVTDADTVKRTSVSGDTVDTFAGLWSFGELVDESGFGAAYLSASGFNKLSRENMFTVVFEIVDGYSENSGIEVSVDRFVTDDGDFGNDIYDADILSEKTYSITDSDRFSFSDIGGGKCELTGYCFNESEVKIPANVAGMAVESVSADCFLNRSFLVDFIRSDTSVSVNGSPAGSGCVFVVHDSSDFYGAALADSLKLIVLDDYTDFDMDNMLVTASKNLSDSFNSIADFNGLNADFTASFGEGENALFGTGSKAEFAVGNNTFTVTAAIMGDINGDSTADVLDAFFLERAVNEGALPEKEKAAASDFDGDGIIGEADFSSLVNYSLSI